MLSDHLCQDPLGPLVQDLCIRHLRDNLCKISVSGSLCKWSFGSLVSGSYRTTYTRSPIRMLSDRLCQDPLGPLVQDLCIKILWDNLCKISVSGSLCEDLLDHLYQDPVGALVQDLCSRIFWPTVSGSYRRICARSLYQDPVGQLVQDLCCRISVWGSWPLVSGSYRTTCTRSRIRIFRTTCVRIL